MGRAGEKQYYDNLTPVTGEVLCQVASSGTDDVDLALDAAHKAKDAWGKMPVQQRANLLLKVADRMEQNIELLANAETWDNGKPIRETSGADVPLAIDHFRYFASCVRAQEGGSAKSTAKPLRIISTNRSAWWRRLSRGTSRC